MALTVSNKLRYTRTNLTLFSIVVVRRARTFARGGKREETLPPHTLSSRRGRQMHTIHAAPDNIYSYIPCAHVQPVSARINATKVDGDAVHSCESAMAQVCRAQEAGNINVFPAHTRAFTTCNWMDGGVLHRRNFAANEPPLPYSVFHVSRVVPKFEFRLWNRGCSRVRSYTSYFDRKKFG